MKISIHAGHNPDGMIACGAVGYMKESTEARNVCNILYDLLNNSSIYVTNNTVNNGKSQSAILNTIVTQINKAAPDLAISIHLNSSDKSSASGVECYTYSTNNIKVNTLTQTINKNISKNIGIPNRGTKINTSLYVLKHTNCPAILIECAFVSSQYDTQCWDANIVAHSIYDAIIDTYNEIPVNGPLKPSTPLYRVQVGAFQIKENAQKLKEDLENQGYSAFITQT